MFFTVFAIVSAAPTAQNFTNIQPFIDQTYNNGASNLYWLNTYTKNLLFATSTFGCTQIGAGGVLYSTGTACGSGSGSSGYPFPLPGNATSTLTQFNGGLTSYASTTIGGGTSTSGLTISGYSTTTGNAYVLGNMGIGTTTPRARLSLDTHTTAAGGINFGDATANLYRNAPGALFSDGGFRTTDYVITAGYFQSGGNFIVGGVLQQNQSGAVINYMSGQFQVLQGANQSIGYPYNTPASLNGLLVASTSAFGTTTPWAYFSINPDNLGNAVPEFVIGSSSKTHLVVLGNGNVGIGTTSPGSLFGINGIVNFTPATTSFSSSAGVNILGGCYAINGVCITGSGGGGGVTAVTAGVGFLNRGLSITSSGTLNVGIATSTTPSLGGLATWTGVGDATNPASLGTVATSAPTATAPITYSGTLGAFVGGVGGAFDCTSASASVKGCLTAADYSRFNSATTTFGSGYATTTLGSLTFSTTTSTTNGLTSALTIVPTAGALTFTPSLSGTLAIAGGGTNATSFTPNTLVFYDGTRLISTTSQLTVNNIIASSTTAVSEFWGNVGISSSTPWGQLAVNPIAGQSANKFVIGSSSATSFLVNNAGVVGVGTLNPTEVNANSKLTVAGTGIQAIVASSTDNTTTSASIFETYAFPNKTYIGSHASAQTVSRFGLTLGGWSEIAATSTVTGQNIGGMVIGTVSSAPLVFGTTNFERMRIESGGFVAIGTTTSAKTTLIVGSSTAPQLTLTDDLNTSAWNLRDAGSNLYFATSSPTTYATTTGTNNSPLWISGTGFGTTTLVGLNVTGVATSTANVGFNITTGCYAISGTCISGGGSGSGTVSSGLAGQLGFYNTSGTTIVGTSTNPLYVDNLVSTSTKISSFIGNLGIGTTSAPSILTVGSTAAQLTSVNPQLLFGTSTLVGASSAGTYMGINSPTGFTGDYIHIQNNGTLAYKMSQSTTGLYLLGTSTNTVVPGKMIISSSTTAQITLNDGLGATTPWNIRSVGSALYISTSSATSMATSTNPVFASVPGLQGKAGATGIGTSTPGFGFGVEGTFGVNGLITSTAGNAVCVIAGGMFVTAGANTCVTSSKFTKKDIEDMTFERAKYVVERMNTVSFTYKDSGDKEYGFIAEEVEKIDPRLVDHAKSDTMLDGHLFKKGDPISVNYGNYTAVLSKYIQGMSLPQKSSSDNWKWFSIIGLFVVWNTYLTIKKKR